MMLSDAAGIKAVEASTSLYNVTHCQRRRVGRGLAWPDPGFSSDLALVNASGGKAAQRQLRGLHVYCLHHKFPNSTYWNATQPCSMPLWCWDGDVQLTPHGCQLLDINTAVSAVSAVLQ